MLPTHHLPDLSSSGGGRLHRSRNNREDDLEELTERVGRAQLAPSLPRIQLLQTSYDDEYDPILPLYQRRVSTGNVREASTQTEPVHLLPAHALHQRTVSAEDLSTISDSTVDFELVKLWIGTCEAEHAETCGVLDTIPLKKKGSRETVDIILIDVTRDCLVRSTTQARYFALSYVWGGVTQLRASTSLCDELMQPYSLLKHRHLIPPVVHDAIKVVRSIGERYLWVDALGIPDDDDAVKHHQISCMAEIYRDAVTTIAAVSSRDANSNLPGLLPGSRWALSTRRPLGKPVLARPLRPDLVLKAIDRSVYASRGWTFQERLLSRRCMYVLDEQVYFQCQRELWCEKSPASLLQPANIGSLYKTPGVPAYDFHLNVLARAPAWAADIAAEKWDAAVAFYAEIVREYSRKQFTFESDVVNAFAGIGQILESYSGWPLAQGIPEQLLEVALLWTPCRRAERRCAAPASPMWSAFPSWSWTGWVGAVNLNLSFDTAVRELHSAVVGIAIDRSNNFLHFRANTTSATKFRFEQAGPWTRSFRIEAYADPRASQLQDGVWVIDAVTKEDCGFLYAVTAAEIRAHNPKFLRFVLLSYTNSTGLIHFPRQESKTYMHDQIVEAEQAGRLSFQKEDEREAENARLRKMRLRLSGWEHHVMLVVARTGGAYERVAVGHIQESSWARAGPNPETILLG